MPASDCALRDNMPIIVPNQMPSQQQQSPWQQLQRAVIGNDFAQRSSSTQTPEEWHSDAGGAGYRSDAGAAEAAMLQQPRHPGQSHRRRCSSTSVKHSQR
eukprot:TRINITY_DN8076_c0_g3_i1.p1 TRINITY_DN8076_c0_g3~~TRINITY_DN8076_c0_g3_i1.p1  ORF type:complete len:100 (-),score=11.39 TRINITY_DN8076_c0_g3_i1:120-419(-)